MIQIVIWTKGFFKWKVFTQDGNHNNLYFQRLLYTNYFLTMLKSMSNLYLVFVDFSFFLYKFPKGVSEERN